MRQQTPAAPGVIDRFHDVVSAFARLPLPGHGDTWERFELFASLAEEDLSLARLGEGHADALAILDEAGDHPRDPDASYGVWAARPATGGVTATPVSDGWQLSGRKPFCSGSGILDRALITAQTPDGYQLFDVSTADAVVATEPGSWVAVGMADSSSETLTFGGPVLARDAAVGPPEFYTERPGFWFGACGVAACWYGGARGLMAGVVGQLKADPDQLILAEIGKAAALLAGMRSALRDVAGTIDTDPEDKRLEARLQALVVRQVVHSSCEAILRHAAAAGGARPLCHDASQARRAADLYVYLAQHHEGADAASLGRLTIQRQRAN